MKLQRRIKAQGLEILTKYTNTKLSTITMNKT